MLVFRKHNDGRVNREGLGELLGPVVKCDVRRRESNQRSQARKLLNANELRLGLEACLHIVCTLGVTARQALSRVGIAT